MSMREYPLHDYGLLITDEVAAWCVLAADKAQDTVPDEVQALLDAGDFARAARGEDGFELPADYQDAAFAIESLDMMDTGDAELNSQSHMEFTGDADVLKFPEDGDTEPYAGSFGYSNAFMAYLPAEREPDLFRPAYASGQELVDEFKAKLKGILPDGFDYRRALVQIDGTYFA